MRRGLADEFSERVRCLKMQKINIVCVGKLKEKFFADAVAEYCKRLTRFAQVSIRELPEKRTLSEEADLILREMRGYVIALAVEGKQVSSPALAERIKALCDAGKEMTFVIGSSCGLDARVKQAANELAFCHYPVEVSADDRREVFASFDDARRFVGEIFAVSSAEFSDEGAE